MHRKLRLVTAGLGLASTLLAPPALAHGHGGFGRFFFRAPIVVSPPVVTRYREERRIRYITKRVKPTEPVLKYADGLGRRYDLLSRVWFDGTNQCWTGKSVFAFVGGSWFYGSAPWRQANGTWQTTAADAPSPVACDTVAAFAPKLAPVATEQAANKTESGKEGAKSAALANAAQSTAAEPTKTGDAGEIKSVTQSAECKRYFPNLGEMVAVPCSD
jgi:hypothetical protein